MMEEWYLGKCVGIRVFWESVLEEGYTQEVVMGKGYSKGV